MPKKQEEITLRDVLHHIQSMKQDLLGRIDALDCRMDRMEHRMERVENKIDVISTQIQNIDERLDDVEVKRLPKIETSIFGKR